MEHVRTNKKTMQGRVASLGLTAMSLGITLMPLAAAAQVATWDPTLLVNTESFSNIDAGDGSTNIELWFGATATNRLEYNVGSSLFNFTAGLNVQGNLAASGSLTLNDDEVGDATITFGNATANQNLTYSDANNRFEFSDDLYVTSNVTAAGVLSGASLTVSSSGISIGGIAYQFPISQGGANNVLFNDGNGNLQWTDVASILDTVGSGTTVSMHPEYPNATYEGDGSNNVGQMRLVFDSGDNQNYYYWTTSKAAVQDYDIVVRMQIPDDFDSWMANGITYGYKAGGTASVTVTVFDTANASDHADGAQTSATFATQSITSTELNGTYTAGGYVTVRIKLTADSTNPANMGYLDFDYYKSIN